MKRLLSVLTIAALVSPFAARAEGTTAPAAKAPAPVIKTDAQGMETADTAAPLKGKRIAHAKHSKKSKQ